VSSKPPPGTPVAESPPDLSSRDKSITTILTELEALEDRIIAEWEPLPAEQPLRAFEALSIAHRLDGVRAAKRALVFKRSGSQNEPGGA